VHLFGFQDGYRHWVPFFRIYNSEIWFF